MKAVIYGLLMILLGIGILTVTVFTIGIDKITVSLKNISVINIAGFLSLSILAMFLASYRWKKILQTLGFDLKISDLFQFNLMGFAVGYITPVGRIGGAPARMIFMEKKGVPKEKGLSSVLLDNIIENTFDALFGITIICLFLTLKEGVPETLKITVIAGMILLFLAICTFYYLMYTGKRVFSMIFSVTRLTKLKLFSWTDKEIHQLDTLFTWFLRNQKFEFLRIFTISAMTWAILIVQYKIALATLGQDATIFQTLLMMAGLAVVAVTPIPAGLGVLEFGQATIFLILGMNPATGIAFAILIRIRDFFITMLGASSLLQYGMANLTNGTDKKSK